MNSQRLAIALTVINLVLMTLVLSQIRPTVAQGVPPVLRGRALEIVDERGRILARINVEPGVTMPDGKSYPETVMLRLIDPKGRPEVKLGAAEQGGGLGLAGESDTTHVVLEVQGPVSSLRLANKDGREQIVNP